jgi:hypothetical protein
LNMVEIVCKELWGDLDTVQKSHDLQKKMVYDSDYLVGQFLLLQTRLEKLVQTEDAESFLLEDIHYVAQLVDGIEQKYYILCNQLTTQAQTKMENIFVILEKSKGLVLELYGMNKEVIAS